MSRCLYCYQELGEGETDFHPQCGKKIFGSKTVPLLPYTKADIKQLAEQVIRSQTTLTGVQAKLSLDISSSPTNRNALLSLVYGDVIFSNRKRNNLNTCLKLRI